MNHTGMPPPQSFPKFLIGNPNAFNAEDAFSSSVSSLSFAFFAFIFMFLRGVMRGSFPPHSCLQGGKLFSSPALRKHHLGVVVDAGVLELIWLEER